MLLCKSFQPGLVIVKLCEGWLPVLVSTVEQSSSLKPHTLQAASVHCLKLEICNCVNLTSRVVNFMGSQSLTPGLYDLKCKGELKIEDSG